MKYIIFFWAMLFSINCQCQTYTPFKKKIYNPNVLIVDSSSIVIIDSNIYYQNAKEVKLILKQINDKSKISSIEVVNDNNSNCIIKHMLIIKTKKQE